MFVYNSMSLRPLSIFFFFNDTATTEIYTLSLHDALPISPVSPSRTDAIPGGSSVAGVTWVDNATNEAGFRVRSEEHTSELQSLAYLVCRLLLEKKKIGKIIMFRPIRNVGRSLIQCRLT